MRRAYLRQPGCLVQANSGRLLLGITITLIVLCVANKSAKIDLELNNWIQHSSTIQNELNYIVNSIGDGTGSNSELIIQTPVFSPDNNNHNSVNNFKNVLNVDALMIHLEAMAIATHVTIDLYDVTWSLKDLCFRPTLPNFEGFELSILLDKMMPCNIKTPLDCFWEGAKLHHSSSSSSDILPNGQQPFGLKKWTEFDPIKTIKLLKFNHKHSSFDYQSLIDWMERVGIKHGYQRKPCLDPSDPMCPDTAPNKYTKLLPNIGKELTGGCYGVAENQMHWREEEIVGGSVKNKTGYIIKANAIQSSIPLMCEQDMYDYWRKTEQTQDITNWSVEKARIILETWERRFKDALQQFAKSSLPFKSGQKIHSMTTKSMLEPIDIDLLVDYKNFLLSFSLMTLIICISFPKFKYYSIQKNVVNYSKGSIKDKLKTAKNDEQQKFNEDKQQTKVDEDNYKNIYIEQFHTLLLALATSFAVGLTFVASLGISTFMNLPFNMATTQILPPVALYYGFNQLNTIVNIYSQRYGIVPIYNLTTSCLNELFPIIMIESISYSIALLVSTIIPIPATRALALQAITYIFTATFVSIVLLPAILTTFLLRYHKDSVCDNDDNSYDEDDQIKHKSTGSAQNSSKNTTIISKYKHKSTSCSKNKCAKETKSDENDYGEIDHIFSRIQDDLKNIQKDSRNNTPTDLNFSTNIDVDGQQTYNLSSLPREVVHNTPFTGTPSSNQVPNSRINNDLVLDANMLPDLLVHATPKFLVSQSNTHADSAYTDNYIKNNSIKDSNTGYKDDHTILDINCNDKTTTIGLGSDTTFTKQNKEEYHIEENEDSNESDFHSRLFDYYTKTLTSNRYRQASVCLILLIILILLLPYAHKVKYGLHLKDIVAQGTEQYDSFSAQEKYFSVYNIFAITKGNFDYPSNQKLLHEYYKSISQIDGIIEDKNVSRFWLVAFRDWLLDIQSKFDIDRNESRILVDGWTSDASDSAKLGYKLLAQTGKIDNPIDRTLVGTNRLVDSNGIINQKAFYHYLTAWVSCDAYVYATTEANFRPEPKIMNDNPDNLRIEKARPLIYTQIPFLMKLPSNQDNVKVISDIRSISHVFEQLNLPNFPTGIPFIFWDQFINLEILMLTSFIIGFFSIFIVIFLMTSDTITAAILTIPIILTSLELYCLIGYFSIPFNNILAVLLIGSIGMMMTQTVPYVTFFTNKDGNLSSRTIETIESRSKIVITSLGLLFLCALVFYCSRIAFINKYSYLLICLLLLNLLNSLLLTPIALSLFGSDYKPKEDYCEVIECKTVKSSSIKTRSAKDKSHRGKARCNSGRNNSSDSKTNKGSRKKRGYPRKIQSEISLSTISEEQSEAPFALLQHDLSNVINC